MKHALKKPYIYWTIGIFLGYELLNAWLSGFYTVLQQIPYFLDTINWSKLIFSIVLATIIGMLIAINTVLMYRHWRQRQVLKQAGLLSSLGIVGGFATGVCTACITGLFPRVFSLFGITFTWTFLPWNGIEIQLLTIVLLVTSIFLMTRKKGCKEQT